MLLSDAAKYSVRMKTITIANSPVPMAIATCSTPPASSLSFSGFVKKSVIAVVTWWLISSTGTCGNCSWRPSSQSCEFTRATMRGISSTSWLTWSTMIGTTASTSAATSRPTPVMTMRIEAQRGSPRRSSQLIAGSRPRARKSAAPM